MFGQVIYGFSPNNCNNNSSSGNQELSAYLRSEFLKTVIPKLYK